jgi:serine/threonine protein kinase
MNTERSDSGEIPSATALGRMESACDLFEAACKDGHGPRIEDYWQEADGPPLLRELIALELVYRLRRRERPEPGEYQARFPGHPGAVRSAFEAVAASTPLAGAPAPARPDADRNLLFGVLAMQMDFVTREALIAGVSAWVLDKSKPLDRILVEQGALAPDERDLLEPLIRKHLERHGGDPGRSLASLRPPGRAREVLRSVADPDVHESLLHLGSPVGAETWLGDPDLAESTSPTPGAARFRALRPLAKGGLGEVFVARDEELRRDVALKLIQEQHASDPDSRHRFRFEAETTGRLEHPGIVPVYGLGVDERGRPYYAMRLIRGETLKEAIARFHTADGPMRDPGRRSLALRELLARFISVCNTIAYAHGRGILHRDIKPANILLGPYGETLVMDWGLAKAAGRPADEPPAPDGTLRPESAGDLGATQSGEWLGTPSFMSPEQAAGRIDALGPASDVYSLGATLYNLLTGRPAFDGTDVFAILGQVREGDFPPPRSVDPTIDRALEAICLKAMANEPEGRYASCRALAEDVERWMADEPVSAWQEPFGRQARRWARRHRTLATASAVAMLASVVGLSAVLAVQTRAKDALAGSLARESRANQALGATNVQLARSRAAVQARYDLAVRAIRTFHTGVSEDVLLKEEQFKELRDRLLGSAGDFYDNLGTLLEGESDPGSRRALVQAEFEVAELTAKVGRRDAALAAHRRVLALREALAARPKGEGGSGPGDDEARADIGRSLTAIAGLLEETGDTDGAVKTYRQAEGLLAGVGGAAPASTSERIVLANCRSRLGGLLLSVGKPGEALPVLRRARAEQDSLAAAPGASDAIRDDLVRTIDRMGALYSQTGRSSEAEDEYREALGIVRKLAGDHPDVAQFRSNLANTHRLLGGVLRARGKMTEAGDEYREALETARKLAVAYPAVSAFRDLQATIHTSLGHLDAQTGRTTDALDEYRKADAIVQKLADDHPAVASFRESLATSRFSLGRTLVSMGRPTEADREFEEAMTIRRKLADDHPGVPQYRNALALSHVRVGGVLRASGRLDAAAARFREAQRIQRKLVDDSPSVTEFRGDLATTHYNLGLVLSSTMKRADAEPEFREALRLQRQLVDANPGLIQHRNALAMTHIDLGWLLYLLGRHADAQVEQREAIAILRKLVDENPSVTDFQLQQAQAHRDLGTVWSSLSKRPEAEAEHRRALAIRRKLAADNPKVPEFRRELTRSLNGLGEVMTNANRVPEAIDLYKEASDIAESLVKDYPQVAEFQLGLAFGLSGLGRNRVLAGDFAKAATDLRRAIAIRDKQPFLRPGTRYDLARSHALLAGLGSRAGSGVTPDEGRVEAERAMAELKRSFDEGYRNPEIDGDTYLDPLRNRPDFKLLMLDLAFPADPFAPR